MRRVHIVELGLELEPQLHLFLMIRRVLSEVLLQFQTHLLLIHHLSLQLFANLLLSVKIFFKNLLIVGLFLGLLLIVTVEFVKFGLVLLRNFTDQHTVVSAAAVLEQDRKDFPNARNYRILLLSVLQAAFDQFIEAHRVDEEGSIDTIDDLNRDASIRQNYSVDTVAIDGVLVLGLKDDAWDVEVLCVLQCLIDPRLQYLWAHLHLLVFALEASALSFLFSGGAIIGSSCCHCQILITLYRLVFAIGSAATRSWRLKVEITRHAFRSSAILAVHLLAQLLGYDGDVQEALEGTLLADSRQGEPLTT